MIGARAKLVVGAAAALMCVAMPIGEAHARTTPTASEPAVCQDQRALTGNSPEMQTLRLALHLRCDSTGARSFDDIDDAFPRIPATGDFNGDGKTDVLDYASGNRSDQLWYGTATGFRAGAPVSISGLYFPFVGDFNGDGKDDVLWFPLLPGGETSVWYGSGGSKPFVAGPALDAPQFIPQSGGGADMYVPGLGDFNGDGKTDIGWLDEGFDVSGTGRRASIIWYGRSNGFQAASMTVPTPPCFTLDNNRAAKADDVIQITVSVCSSIVEDFNGDGKTDLLFYRSGSEPDAIEYSTGTGFRAGPAISVSGLYEFPFAGDFNGDAKSDVFWYAPGPAHDYVWYGKASGFRPSIDVEVNGTYQPVTGDFNGDGKDDIVWYAPGAARDYLRYGSSSGFRDGPAVGVNGIYDPRVGDFNGDGKADIVWFSHIGKPSHIWYGAASGFHLGNPVRL
ncbi:MAG TPA: VCBS repeat-containing protein [Acidimicrobiia bacterium]